MPDPAVKKLFWVSSVCGRPRDRGRPGGATTAVQTSRPRTTSATTSPDLGDLIGRCIKTFMTFGCLFVVTGTLFYIVTSVYRKQTIGEDDKILKYGHPIRGYPLRNIGVILLSTGGAFLLLASFMCFCEHSKTLAARSAPNAGNPLSSSSISTSTVVPTYFPAYTPQGFVPNATPPPSYQEAVGGFPAGDIYGQSERLPYNPLSSPSQTIIVDAPPPYRT